MFYGERIISEEQYQRAMERNGNLADMDLDDVFSLSEQIGYGIYFAKVDRNEIGKPIVRYSMGDSCD